MPWKPSLAGSLTFAPAVMIPRESVGCLMYLLDSRGLCDLEPERRLLHLFVADIIFEQALLLITACLMQKRVRVRVIDGQYAGFTV